MSSRDDLPDGAPARSRQPSLVPPGNAPVPYGDLQAPRPAPAAPPPPARWLAFLGILVGGLLGGLIGWGVGDLLGGSSTWAAVGGLVGGVSGAVGVGIIAGLTLRAMNEWSSVRHPEAE